MTTRLAVLTSGQGLGLRAVVEAIASGRLDAGVEVVIATDLGVAALEWARDSGLRTSLLSAADLPRLDRRLAAVLAVVESAGVDLVVLDGFADPLSQAFIDALPGRLIASSPALLPAFGGEVDPIGAALKAGARVVGCTVLFLTTAGGLGGIIVQRPVEIRRAETEESVRDRVELEERLGLVEALQLVGVGRASLREGRVVFD